ncbi:hypothetical protein Hte_010485 [Hypoxylon texense]
MRLRAPAVWVRTRCREKDDNTGNGIKKRHLNGNIKRIMGYTDALSNPPTAKVIIPYDRTVRIFGQARGIGRGTPFGLWGNKGDSEMHLRARRDGVTERGQTHSYRIRSPPSITSKR